MVILQKRLFWIILGLALSVQMFGQKQTNPFELKKEGESLSHLLEKEPAPKPPAKPAPAPQKKPDPQVNPFEVNPPDWSDPSVLPENPFEVVFVKNAGPAPEIQKQIQESIQSVRSGEESQMAKILLSIFLLFILILLAIVMSLYREDLNKIYKAFINHNMFQQLYRDRGDEPSTPFWVLNFIFALTGGSFLYFTANYFGFSAINQSFAALILCILLVGLLAAFKQGTLSFLGFVFPVEKELGQYKFIIHIFNQVIGIGLIPFVLFVAFAPENFRFLLIFSALSLLGLVYLFRSLRGLFVGSKFFMFHKFHFFIYLCAVEIAPLLLLWKLILLWSS